MNTDPHASMIAGKGDIFVRRPRATDALGHALRGVFGATTMPDDFTVLLRRLDRITH